MTDTASAAASGSPSTFDRRSFLATLAAAGVMTAGATVSAAAADHPDAALLDLVAALSAAQARWGEIDSQADNQKIFERCDALMPAVPVALLHQEDRDTWEICHSPDRLPRIQVAGQARRHYAEDAHVPSLRWKIGKWRQERTGADVVDRAEEIIAALDPYLIDVERAEDASGVTAFHESSRRNQALIDTLYRDIASVPAFTLEGVAAKARAAAAPWSDNPAYLGADLLPCLLAGEKSSFGDRPEILLAVSLIVDAMKLGMVVPSLPSKRSAA